MNKRYSTLALGILLAASAFAQVLGVKGEKSSSFGFYIKDLKTDKVVFESEADRVLVPASITKSLTSATSLLTLGKDFRFKTEVYTTGSIDNNGVLDGNLIVKAVGDPTIESRHFDTTKGFCDSIAVSLKRLGVKQIKGDISVLADMIGQGAIPEWEIDDVAWGYGAGLYGMNFRDNTFTIWPATKRTEPHVPGLDVTVHHSADGTDVIRGINSNKLIIEGSKPTDTKWAVTSTMPDPAAVFKYALVEKLKKSDISIAQNCLPAKQISHTVYTHYSPVITEILRSLMLRSDNMFAEAMLRATKPNLSRSEALKAEMAFWKDKGLDTDLVILRDGSGLARADRFSPRFIGGMLEWMAKSKVADEYINFFPVAGQSGTLKSFMANTRLAGKLAMKTGSMNGVQTYAGYLLDENKKPTHVVVVMCNSFFCSRAELKDAIAAFLLKTL